MKRERGRPKKSGIRQHGRRFRTAGMMRIKNDVHPLGFAQYDGDSAKDATPLSDYIPSRLPNLDGIGIVRDLILSVAYGCGGWSTANRLLDNPPDRMTADDVTLDRLNRVKQGLLAQGWDYESLRGLCFQSVE